MKRVILSILGTAVAVVALLSFKSHSPLQPSGALPSAVLPQVAAPGRPGTSHATSAPPLHPGPASTSGTARATQSTLTHSTGAASRTTLGSVVQTRYGIVQVKVVTVGSKITGVSFAQLTAFDGRSASINGDAGPVLLQQTLTAQNAQVDGVSGATYTSDGYRTSLQYALDHAGLK